MPRLSYFTWRSKLAIIFWEVRIQQGAVLLPLFCTIWTPDVLKTDNTILTLYVDDTTIREQEYFNMEIYQKLLIATDQLADCFKFHSALLDVAK